MILNEDEIIELTGRKRRDCQKRFLQCMGIKYIERPDCTLAVNKEHVDQVMGVVRSNPIPQKKTEPNWDALNA